uniref:Ig-like domain-containing protein n=1 Tax=Nothobranchius furzeri TaxID=105023 RepID=A0A8C6LG43_NOTFU
KHGDASLRISDVRLTDNGRYRCYVPKDQTENYVYLLVGSVSSPEIRLAGLDEGSSGVMLDCSSGTWWPEPELLWLDAEGHVLSAGPTETTRGSDGLLAVSSRVTVQKSPNNTITCRIHQKDLKQSRETHVHVPAWQGVWATVLSPQDDAGLRTELKLVIVTVYKALRTLSQQESLVMRQKHVLQLSFIWTLC